MAAVRRSCPLLVSFIHCFSSSTLRNYWLYAFVKRPTEINEDNIEPSIKQWAEEGGYSIAKVESADAFFAYMITTQNGNQIQVVRSNKQKSGNIQFVTTMNAPAPLQALLGTLSTDQLTTLTEEISADLDKQKIGFSMNAGISPQQVAKSNVGVLFVALQKGVPIKEMNEDIFWQNIDDLNFGAQFVIADSDLILKRLTSSTVVNSTTKTTATQ